MAGPTLQTYRDTIRRLSPRWLQGPIAGGLLYAFGLHLDALVDGAAYAVRRRFPGLDSYGDEIEPLGRERRIRRGRSESDASYSARLARWLDDHRMRGGPYAMLRQLGGFFSAAPRAADLVYENGRRYHLAADGTITRDFIPWITPTARPMRYWVVISWPEGVRGDGNWGDAGTWDDGGVWDFNITDLSYALARDLCVVPGDWQPAHAIGYVCLLPSGLVTDVSHTIWDNADALSAAGIAKFEI
jgi:hypothetical protein